MGTASYMSPEQARGKSVDKRADVWAFGCCLYEALTGHKAFEGETVTDTLAEVVKNEPEWERLPPEASSLLRFVLMQCLRKKPDERTHDIADVRVALSALEDVGDPGTLPPRGRSSRLPWLVAATALIAAAAIVWSSATTESDTKVVRFSVSTSGAERVQLNPSQSLAISPDGRTLVYASHASQESVAAGSPLYVRELSSTELRTIPGTAGARSPLISPDGGWIVFHQQGALKRVALTGGNPVELVQTSQPRGAHWGRDGFIYYQQLPEGLFRISPDGGVPESVLAPDPESREKSYRLPYLLPGGRPLLYTISLSSMTSYDEARIAAFSIDDGTSKNPD